MMHLQTDLELKNWLIFQNQLQMVLYQKGLIIILVTMFQIILHMYL